MENFIKKPKVQLLNATHGIEETITASAKLCYSNLTPSQIMEKLEDGDVVTFLNRIMALGHGSVLEHAMFTFAIEDISRVTETQLVRQRTGSFSVQSGRYVKRDPHYIVPKEIMDDEELLEIFTKATEHSTRAYKELTDKMIEKNMIKEFGEDHEEVKKSDLSRIEKGALEDARYILPQALRTHMVFSIDLRNFMNFISHRRCKRAQSEIQEVANQMLELVKDLIPTIYKYIGAGCEVTKCTEGAMNCGKPYPKKK